MNEKEEADNEMEGGVVEREGRKWRRKRGSKRMGGELYRIKQSEERKEEETGMCP